MKREEYFEKARELYENGEIDGDVYDAIVMNAYAFCEDELYIEDIIMSDKLDKAYPEYEVLSNCCFNGTVYYLLENKVLGDEVPCKVVNENLDEVGQTYDCLIDFLEDKYL